MNNSNRFGLGEPVYTPRAVRHSPAHRTYGMSATKAETKAENSASGEKVKTYGNDIGAAAIQAVADSTYEQTKKACDQVGGAANKYVGQILGLIDDLFSENQCERKQALGGNELNACVARIVGSQLGYLDEEGRNLAYRTFEALAFATKRTAQLKWRYAGYVRNGKAPNGIGTAYGSKDTTPRGLKEREEGDVGPCRLKNIIAACLKQAVILEEMLRKQPNLADKRLVMLGWLLMWIPGRFDVKTAKGTHGVCRGLDFLVKDALKAPRMQEFLLKEDMSALTGASQGELEATGGTSPPSDSGDVKPVTPGAPSARPTRVAAKSDPALAKARLEATKAAFSQAKAAGDLKKAQLAADPVAMAQLAERKAELLRAKTGESSQPAEAPKKSGAGGMIALAAAGLGAYFMLKG